MGFKQEHSSNITKDKIRYGLTNDYMFRAVFQKSNSALRHLVAAQLSIPYESITSCTILNPIELGEAIGEKNTILDIKLELNHSTLMNIEMQIGNYSQWCNRSLYYLSGLYRNLASGQDYSKIKTAIHFGILTKSPFSDVHEFYSEYFMMNSKTGHIYSRNFSIRMLCLDQLENVSEAERSSELYQWAKLFLATTWKEVQTLAVDHEYLSDAASYLRQLTEDEKIKLQCEAREKYYFEVNAYKQDGIDEGLRTGIKQGIKQGIERVNRLAQCLLKDNRMDDLIRSYSDQSFQQQLMKEYGI